MAAVKLDSVCQTLSQIAPLRMAESWDNVGLLIGDRGQSVENVITCLTVTPAVVAEAIDRNAGLIVTHHPIPFRPLTKITCDTIAGKILWQLIGAKVAVYSAHTAFDSAAEGINQSWAESLRLGSVQAISDPTPENELGSGRLGVLSTAATVRDVILRCNQFVRSSSASRAVGSLDRLVTRVGFACGSGGSFISPAHRQGCELLITGEATFHSCLEAESLGISLGLLGHFHSERFAMEQLAGRLAKEFPELTIWPSEREADPLGEVVAT